MLCALLLGLAPAAMARESDRDQPIELQAEDGDMVLAEDGVTRLRGSVVISQGTLRIAAQNAELTRTGGEMARVVLEGNPASLQQQGEDGRQVHARAQRIDYDVKTEVVTLTGNVSVNQGGDDLRGQRITYDLKSERLNASGQGSEDGRIRMTIQPRARQPAAGTDSSD